MNIRATLLALSFPFFLPSVLRGEDGANLLSPRVTIEQAVSIARGVLLTGKNRGKDKYIVSAEFQSAPIPRWVISIEGIPAFTGNHQFIVIDMARRVRVVDGR